MLAVITTHLKEFFKRIRFIYYFCGLAVIALLIWSFALRQPDGQFHLTLFRAETGTALYARSPNGQTLLIDPSGSSNTLAGQLSQTVFPWNFHIDTALLTNRGSVQPLTDLDARLPVKLAILTPAVYQVTDDQAALSLPEGMQQKKLAEAESIRVDSDLVIQPLAADASDTALLLTYQQLRILIPNGVDPALLASSSANLDGLSVLILNDTDLANLPADMWQNFGAKTILWNSTNLAPDPAWSGLDTSTSISLKSNGQQFGMTTTQ